MSKNPYTTFSTYLDPALKAAVQARATKDGISIRAIVEAALRSHLGGSAPVAQRLCDMDAQDRIQHGCDVLTYLKAQGSLRVLLTDKFGEEIETIGDEPKRGTIEGFHPSYGVDGESGTVTIEVRRYTVKAVPKE